MGRKSAVTSPGFDWAPDAQEALAEAAFPPKGRRGRPRIDPELLAEVKATVPGKLSKAEKVAVRISGEVSAERPTRSWKIEPGSIAATFRFTRSVFGPEAESSGIDIPSGTVGAIVEIDGERCLFQSTFGLLWVRCAHLRQVHFDD